MAFCNQCGATVNESPQQAAPTGAIAETANEREDAAATAVSETSDKEPSDRATSQTVPAAPRHYRILNISFAAAAVVIVGIAIVDLLWTRPTGGPVVNNQTKTNGPVLPDLEAEITRSVRVTPASGGAVDLPDGTRVNIPAGAVDAARTLTIKKLKDVGPEAKGRRMYDIDLGGITLTRPATLTFRFDPKVVAEKGAKQKPKAAYFKQGKGWIDAPGEVDMKAGVVTVRTTHFSRWLFLELYWWERYLWALKASAGPLDSSGREWNYIAAEWSRVRSALRPAPHRVMLSVPYYGQGSTDWCWAASAQMLLKHYGENVEIWDIGEKAGFPSTKGMTGFDLTPWWNTDKFTRILLECGMKKVEGTYNGFFTVNNFCGYLIYQLLEGRPVYVFLGAWKHVVVVTGFDRRRIYFHDPAGYNWGLTKLRDRNIRNTDGTPPQDE
jgi:hypothetical protein